MTSEGLLSRLAVYGPNEQQVRDNVLTSYGLILFQKQRLSKDEFTKILLEAGTDKARSFAEYTWGVYDAAWQRSNVVEPVAIVTSSSEITVLSGFNAFHI
jgi:hypothetical protein